MNASENTITLRKSLLFIAILLAVAMEVLDISITNVSIVYISGDLAVTPFMGTWIISSYALGNSLMIIIAGFIAQRFGERRTYKVTVILFTLLSALCGLSTTFPMLLGFRALQGISAGPMVPLSTSILLSSFPKSQRGTVLAIQSVVLVIAPIFGPVLGGVISEFLGWRWIFYINVPIGVLCSLLNFSLISSKNEPTKKVPVDFFGLALLTLGVGSLQMLLDRGNELGWLDSQTVVILLCITIVALSLFIPWTLFTKNYIVNLHLFKYRNFTIGIICALLSSVAIYGLIVLFPIWLQTTLGYTAYQTGITMMPFAVLIVVVAPVVQLLNVYYSIDERIFVVLGFLFFFPTFLMLSRFNVYMTPESMALPGLLIGGCMGLFYVPLLILGLHKVPDQQLAFASSLIGFIRTLGMGLGASIAIGLMQYRQKVNLELLYAPVNEAKYPVQAILEKLKGLGYTPQLSTTWIFNQASHQSYMLATNDYYRLSAYLFLFMAVFILFSEKATSDEHGDSADAAH